VLPYYTKKYKSIAEELEKESTIAANAQVQFEDLRKIKKQFIDVASRLDEDEKK